MSTALVETENELADTVAELLEQLGGIGPERVLVRPALGTATEVDVLKALEARRKRICELIDGVLVEKAMGYSESRLACYLIVLLDNFVRPQNLGLVTGPDGTIRLWAGRVRIPDVAYFSWESIPGRRFPKEPIPTLAPDLAIEVLSVGNTAREMLLKRENYFSVGVRLVWIVDPRARTVSVYTTSESPAAVLAESDVLDGAPVLPGFTVSLREFFGELDRHG